MDTKSKWLFAVFGLVLAGSLGLTYLRYMVEQDYMIETEMPCDPLSERCLIRVCDPSAEACSGDVETDTTYFKTLYRNAKYIPDCDPADEACTALSCTPGETDCQIETCTESVDDLECSDPAAFAATHPAITETEAVEMETSEEKESDIPTPLEDGVIVPIPTLPQSDAPTIDPSGDAVPAPTPLQPTQSAQPRDTSGDVLQ